MPIEIWLILGMGLIIIAHVSSLDRTSPKVSKLSNWLTKFHFTALVLYWLNVYLYHYHNLDLRGVLVESVLFWLTFFSGLFAATITVLKKAPEGLNVYLQMVKIYSFFVLLWMLISLSEPSFMYKEALYEDEHCRVAEEGKGLMSSPQNTYEVYVFDGLWEKKFRFPTNITSYNLEKIEVNYPEKDVLLLELYHKDTYDNQVINKTEIDTILISGDKTSCTCCNGRYLN